MSLEQLERLIVVVGLFGVVDWLNFAGYLIGFGWWGYLNLLNQIYSIE